MQARDVSDDRAVSARADTRVATPADLAWLGAVPVALVLLAALLLLGPPLGRALFEPADLGFWPYWTEQLGILPEPTERARFLLALLAPLGLAALVAYGARRQPAIPSGPLRIAMHVAQALVPLLLLVTLVAQHRKLFGLPWSDVPLHHVYFKLPTLVVAALVALGLVLALRSARLVGEVAGWVRETRARRLVALTLAVLLTALWLLTAINTDATIVNGHFRIYISIPFWLDEPYAVLNGLTPLVDFTALYGHLLAYAAAVPMALLGPSLGVYSATMAFGTLLAMLALYAVLRRVVGRSLLALALFVPVLSTSFFTELGPLDVRHGPQTLFSVFPLRYLGAYVLAWLVARHVDGAGPRRRWLLFTAAGVVVGNNLEFGLPALGATVLALALADSGITWRRAGRLLADAALGLLLAIVAISLLTLVMSGSLPRFGTLLTFPRVYGLGYFSAMPMPALGFHVAMYVTFAGALVLAVVRWSARTSEPLLTAMLGWAGLFGLAAGSYYVGRSMPEALISLFSIWALAVALLLVASVRAILARPSRRPTAAEVCVLFAFGICVCSIAQTPTPWSQVERLRDTSAMQPYANPPAKQVIRAATRPGEHVAILNEIGHRVAYDLGLRNVVPYSFLNSMPLDEQLYETIDALRAAGGTKLFMPISLTHPEHVQALEAAGFALRARHQQADVIEFEDATAGGG